MMIYQSRRHEQEESYMCCDLYPIYVQFPNYILLDNKNFCATCQVITSFSCHRINPSYVPNTCAAESQISQESIFSRAEAAQKYKNGAGPPNKLHKCQTCGNQISNVMCRHKKKCKCAKELSSMYTI